MSRPNNKKSTRIKPRRRDPTSQSVRNQVSIIKTKEEKWLEKYPDESLSIIKFDPYYNIKCNCCGCNLHCVQLSDLNKHIKSRKHPSNLKAYKSRKGKRRQSLISDKFVSLRDTEEAIFVGFYFASILSLISGYGAVQFSNIFIHRVIHLKNAKKIPRDRVRFAQLVCICRNKLNKWILDSIKSHKSTTPSYTIQLDEGSDKVKAGAWAPLLSFHGSSKPVAIDCVFTETASNSAAASTIIDNSKDKFGLDRAGFRYYLS